MTCSSASCPKWSCEGGAPPPSPMPGPAAKNRCQLSGSVWNCHLPRGQDEGPQSVLSRASGLLLAVQGQSPRLGLGRSPYLSLGEHQLPYHSAHRGSPMSPRTNAPSSRGTWKPPVVPRKSRPLFLLPAFAPVRTSVQNAHPPLRPHLIMAAPKPLLSQEYLPGPLDPVPTMLNARGRLPGAPGG